MALLFRVSVKMNEKFKSFLSYLREEATGGVNYHGIMPKYKF